MLNYYKNGAELRPVTNEQKLSQSEEKHSLIAVKSKLINPPLSEEDNNQYNDGKQSKIRFDQETSRQVRALYRKLRKTKYELSSKIYHKPIETQYFTVSLEA